MESWKFCFFPFLGERIKSLKGIAGNTVALCLSNLKKKRVVLELLCHSRRVLRLFFTCDKTLMFVGFQSGLQVLPDAAEGFRQTGIVVKLFLFEPFPGQEPQAALIFPS